jgi:hypothetical protein
VTGSDYEAEIEGNVAALFQDLIDSNNEGADSTTFGAYYVFTVFKSCETYDWPSWFDRNAVDQLVWCLENKIVSSMHSSNFPGRPSWLYQSESASEPDGWSACDVRSTWVMNVGIDGGGACAPPPPPPASCNIHVDVESESALIQFDTDINTESVIIMFQLNSYPEGVWEYMDTSPSTGGYYSSEYFGTFGDMVTFSVRPFSEDDQGGYEGAACGDTKGIQ